MVRTSLQLKALLTEHEVAALFRISLATVRRWRQKGTGPDFIKLGSSVRYNRGAVLSWLHSRPARGLARRSEEQ
jgi:excisionase family DNA binding protein